MVSVHEDELLAVGVDFKTEFISAAIYQDEKPVTVIIKQGKEPMMPAIAHYAKGERTKVGFELTKKAHTGTVVNVIQNVKTVLGRPFSHKKVKDYINKYKQVTIKDGDELSIPMPDECFFELQLSQDAAPLQLMPAKVAGILICEVKNRAKEFANSGAAPTVAVVSR